MHSLNKVNQILSGDPPDYDEGEFESEDVDEAETDAAGSDGGEDVDESDVESGVAEDFSSQDTNNENVGDGLTQASEPQTAAAASLRDPSIAESIEAEGETGSDAEAKDKVDGAHSEFATGSIEAESQRQANGDVESDDEATEGTQNGDAERVEEIGTADVLEEVPYRPRRMRRSYKIQEVIKRRQVLLVQGGEGGAWEQRSCPYDLPVLGRSLYRFDAKYGTWWRY